MTFNKRAIDIFGIMCGTDNLMEYEDYDVGDMFNSALCFVDVQIEPSQSTIKSLKKLNIELYEGVGKIFAIDDYDNYQTLVFDCGIYAFSLHSRLPEGIDSGSYVKMRFYLVFDEDYHSQLSINGEPLWKVIPGMVYDWKIKDILIWAREGKKGEKYFENLPVAYTSPDGERYKRIRGTDAYNDTGGYDTNYILICEML
ncbi:hypothetical protein [Candidatus Magnetominusculus xianensis]|uniref:Uncharacterized protein n=1 Tax=Candidatus Magnetominusculus xianensis TaxID=1748249 RepID=A0ABR5SKX2_9BACT|nr:hypothetical protein [Candidatus Magnetominusculus xianensis]KWT90978.1 hypothetical protein ASN18_1062 [Candidatus Magnetominusculus xianensis]MBF0403132.1 hypothetical protein [Nitrospirota bacterium]